MLDVVSVVAMVAVFALAQVYVVGCDRLKGTHS